jgi:EpsD family peptidyl-prolyl cis-trans isomerase
MNPTMHDVPAKGRLWLAVAAMLAAAILAGCSEKKSGAASQTAAKVNKDELTVHQINFILQQQRNLRPEEAEVASQRILKGLVEQQLALQKAEALKIDRDQRVMQQIEAARREIVSRAYLERVGQAAAVPNPEEVRKYYDDNPALFKERRIYSLQQIAIEAKPDQAPELRDKLAASKNMNEFMDFVRAKGYRFAGNQVVQAAEQMPLNSLNSLARMKDGQAILLQSPNGIQVVVLAGSRSEPVTEEQARPAIQQFLHNERKRKLVEEDRKALFAAAKIEYVGKFAQAASAAALEVQAPAAAASGNDTDAISRGLGLKK